MLFSEWLRARGTPTAHGGTQPPQLDVAFWEPILTEGFPGRGLSPQISVTKAPHQWTRGKRGFQLDGEMGKELWGRQGISAEKGRGRCREGKKMRSYIRVEKNLLLCIGRFPQPEPHKTGVCFLFPALKRLKMGPLIPLYIARPFCSRGFWGSSFRSAAVVYSGKMHVDRVHARRRWGALSP